MSLLVALVLGALALPQQQGQGQVQVRATLSDDRIGVGQTTVLEVVVETRGTRTNRIELPALPDGLDVITTHQYSQLQMSVPGGQSLVERRQYVIRPRREGRFVIPSAIVTVGGSVIRGTDTLTLTVDAGPGPPIMTSPAQRLGADPDAGELVATLTPDTVWLGEPALLRLTALIPETQGTRRGRAPSFEPPTVQGFWVEELEDRSAVGMRAQAGRYLDLHEYRRMYVPLTTGVHVFPPGRMVYEVGRGWLFAPETHELRSDTVRLYVRGLPEQGQPDAFTGAVGTLSVDAHVEPVELAPGDAAVLTVQITGTGHIKALPAPRLPTFDGVEVYPPNEDAVFTARTTGITGVKRFRWMLVPERAGTIALPAIEYAWFDPATSTYQQATLEMPDLVVRRTVAGTTDTDTALAPLRRTPAGNPAMAWASTPAFAAVQLLPLLLIAFAFVWRRRGPAMRARRAAQRGRAERFARIRARAPGDPRAALSELEHALEDAAADMLPGHGDGILDARMRAAGITDDTVGAFQALRREFEDVRFQPAPVTAAQVEAFATRAEVLLRALAAALRRKPVSAAPALLLLVLVQSVPADGAFERAVAAYDQRAYTDARASLLEHLDAHPDDAAAWYNLGNTELRAGRRGAAIHAWARTLVLQPRADDARVNLRAVDAEAVSMAARRPVPVTAHELRALAGLAWLLAGLLLAWRIAVPGERARRAGFAGAAAVVLCTAALLALAVRTTWPQQAVAVRSTAVRAGPALRAEQRTTLVEGEIARVIELREEWALVRTADGEGWIERRELGVF